MDASEFESIRKAAILVASLDAENAELLLAQLPPEMAEEVRTLAESLPAIDPDEQQRVVVEFCRMRPLVPDRRTGGIELDALPMPAEEPANHTIAAPTANSRVAASPRTSPSTDPARPLAFLNDLDSATIVDLLGDESPQTIAALLAHLPVEAATGLLRSLSPARQADVLRRVAEVGPSDAARLEHLAAALQATLVERRDVARRRSEGRAVISDILGASDPRTREQLLSSLRQHDRELARDVSADRATFTVPEPPPVELEELDDAVRARVANEADRTVLAVALAGMAAAERERWLAHLDPADADAMRRQLARPEPMRLADLEAARRTLAELATRIAPPRISLAA